MRRRLVFFVCGLLVPVCLFGCAAPKSQNGAGRGSSEVAPQLPGIVVGTWRAEDSPWRITLAEDGIESVLVPLTWTLVRPNQTTEWEMKDDSISSITAGECYSEYNPVTKQLFVSVELDEIHIRFMDHAMDGSSVDKFIGKVSEDGKTWTPDNIKIFDYGPDMPQDENDIYPEPMVFEKVVQEGQQE